MKLTKTEQKILDKMNGKRDGYQVFAGESMHGKGEFGGRWSYGFRNFDACRKLVEKGLVRQIGDIYHGSSYHGGTMIHSSIINIETLTNTLL